VLYQKECVAEVIEAEESGAGVGAVSFEFKIGLLYHDSSVVPLNPKLYLLFHE
jgi:hypothetical protein